MFAQQPSAQAGGCFVMCNKGKSFSPESWLRLAEAMVERTLRALPTDLRERLRDVPVLFEERPGQHLIEDGWPGDLLGLFEGPCHGERATDISTQPPTVTLFLANLRDEAGDDPALFRAEVRTTLLHEIGHYLGLDEDGLTARGLE